MVSTNSKRLMILMNKVSKLIHPMLRSRVACKLSWEINKPRPSAEVQTQVSNLSLQVLVVWEIFLAVQKLKQNWELTQELLLTLKIHNLLTCGMHANKIQKCWCNWSKATQDSWMSSRNWLELISWTFKNRKWNNAKKMNNSRRNTILRGLPRKLQMIRKLKKLKRQLFLLKKEKSFRKRRRLKLKKLLVMNIIRKKISKTLSNIIKLLLI